LRIAQNARGTAITASRTAFFGQPPAQGHGQVVFSCLAESFSQGIVSSFIPDYVASLVMTDTGGKGIQVLADHPGLTEPAHRPYSAHALHKKSLNGRKSMRRILLACLCIAVLSPSLFASSHEKAAEEVIAVTKAQWAAQAKKDVAGAMKNVADEYTEFNPEYPTRLDGKELSMKLGEANADASGANVVAEMANPKVQVYGDVAILTYNYIGAFKSKDGEVESVKAKSTRVYVKKDGQSMLVHANFAPLTD
jgi:ketosteroid isomerase-like protein